MKKYYYNPVQHKTELKAILQEVENTAKWTPKSLNRILPKFPRDGKGVFSRDQLVIGYKQLILEKEAQFSQKVMDRLKMKPTRTISGVAPVTVLTKPFPCPGKCIFCPNDVRMPKSYLASEPGAQRAERNQFDPYLQTYNRLKAFSNTGHSTEKVELIILGGTWSFYPESYQVWFVKRCFDALNDFGINDRTSEVKTINLFEEADRIPWRTKEGRRKTYNEIVHAVARGKTEQLIAKSEHANWQDLAFAHKQNETAQSRCVGLVIETRPDYIDEHEVVKLRKLGATKVQIGIQSLNDKVLDLNKRGHKADATYRAVKLLRLAGFKIHAHWMPNLYGSTVKSDIADYKKLWSAKVSPDELKIYPTSIIANTELHERFKQGKYRPYTYEELLHVLTDTMARTPRFCRLTRIIRDIPATDIVEGNKLSNFRQIAENKLKQEQRYCQCIRCREIRSEKIDPKDIISEKLIYKTSTGREYFLSYRTKSTDKILGFLRLAIPQKKLSGDNFISELRNAAVIREVHVYGQVVGIGKSSNGKAQHLGLGKKLIARAKRIALKQGFAKLAVISAIGTREYYKKQGFAEDGMYMSLKIKSAPV